MKYTSHYAELGFYVNGELRKFAGGMYTTDDPAAIAVLDGLADAVRVEGEVEPEESAAETVTPAADGVAAESRPQVARAKASGKS